MREAQWRSEPDGERKGPLRCPRPGWVAPLGSLFAFLLAAAPLAAPLRVPALSGGISFLLGRPLSKETVLEGAAGADVPLAREGDRYALDLRGGRRAILSLLPGLQERIEAYLRRYEVPYGFCVAMEPATGRILSLVSVQRGGDGDLQGALRATYPAASIFKLVTAAAALETGALAPGSAISFRGRPLALGPRNFREDPRRDRETMTLEEALARSSNAVFGRVAVKWVTQETLQGFAEAFAFNRAIPFELPMDTSRVQVPDDSLGLALCGAGFGPATMSPLHAALLAAALGNDGAMMEPFAVETVVGPEGEVLYRAVPRPWGRVVSPETARTLRGMMVRTVEAGTARFAFRPARGRPALSVSVAGKTGSLSGDNPPGRYDWFVGLAPAEEPTLAVAALVINEERWHIKGPNVAREAFAEYFAP